MNSKKIGIKYQEWNAPKWQRRATAKGGTIHLFSISIMGNFWPGP
jgi:hypothetical protein